ncbi:MAG TPA: FAD-dependent oxidoreductase, partial [Nitrososphaeraceae archaeon]|nr:FAD-dependent oxidoreductase [Nitrososphaeraceae archaeon]
MQVLPLLRYLHVQTVTLFERSSKEIGGRARTTEVDGFYFNQGPHALFLTDSTDSILKEIGITYTGGIPGSKGKSYLIRNGSEQEVPPDYGSWLSSGKGDGTSVKSDEIQFFNSPTNLDFSQLEGVTIQEWLDKNIHDNNDAEIIKAILRLNTYGNDPEIQSIGSALRQIYVNSQAGTMYLDGGW